MYRNYFPRHWIIASHFISFFVSLQHFALLFVCLSCTSTSVLLTLCWKHWTQKNKIREDHSAPNTWSWIHRRFLWSFTMCYIFCPTFLVFVFSLFHFMICQDFWYKNKMKWAHTCTCSIQYNNKHRNQFKIDYWNQYI